MRITSPVFDEGQMIPSVYTCDGENFSPPLEIKDVPQEARSLVLIMDDPDAPNGTFTHWLMWNISPDTRRIEENDWPSGAEQGINDGNELGYMGACPPEGIHHYHFKVFALNKRLSLKGEIRRVDLDREINDSVIEKTEIVGLYKLQS